MVSIGCEFRNIFRYRCPQFRKFSGRNQHAVFERTYGLVIGFHRPVEIRSDPRNMPGEFAQSS